MVMSAFELLSRVAAASREVMEAASHPAATTALDALALRQRLERLVSDAVGIFGPGAEATFGRYRPLPSAGGPPSKIANTYQLQAARHCLLRLACYLKMKISEPWQPDVVANNGAQGRTGH